MDMKAATTTKSDHYGKCIIPKCRFPVPTDQFWSDFINYPVEIRLSSVSATTPVLKKILAHSSINPAVAHLELMAELMASLLNSIRVFSRKVLDLNRWVVCFITLPCNRGNHWLAPVICTFDSMCKVFSRPRIFGTSTPTMRTPNVVITQRGCLPWSWINEKVENGPGPACLQSLFTQLM